MAAVIQLTIVLVGLGCRGAGVSAADVVQAGMDAKQKQEDEQVKQMVDHALVQEQRRLQASKSADAACAHLSQLGEGIRDGSVSWEDVLATSGTIAQVREQLTSASPGGRPVMAGTSTAGLGQTMAQSYLRSSDPSLREIGVQQAQLAWLDATRWCTSR